MRDGKTEKRKVVQKAEGSVADGLKNQLARALADYDNLRKRVEREKEFVLQYANKGLVARFLSVYDMLESAQKHAKDSGVVLITEEFKNILMDEGIEKIKVSQGDGFDEDLFDAVEAVETKKKGDKGKVSEVVLSGWRYKDGPVIRPVKVKVYRS
jgi:molecular chaperone GrpE